MAEIAPVGRDHGLVRVQGLVQVREIFGIVLVAQAVGDDPGGQGGLAHRLAPWVCKSSAQ